MSALELTLYTGDCYKTTHSYAHMYFFITWFLTVCLFSCVAIANNSCTVYF